MIGQKVETKASEAILEKPMTVQVGSKSYDVAPPSTATIIMLSEAVSRLPHTSLDPEKVVEECLSIAKDCDVLGEIAAILILGAKNCVVEKKTVQTGGKRYLWGLIDCRHFRVEVYDPMTMLKEEILNECSPRALFEVISKILSTLELSDFFGLTTFLTEINLLRPTKVVNETTVFGQS